MAFKIDDSVCVSAWRSPSLYIGDLPEEVTEAELYKLFSVFGQLESAKVCRNWESGQPLGYGFLNFVSVKDAERALEEYNFKEIRGQPCRLMWSTKRSSSSLKEDHAANVFVKGLSKKIDNSMLFEAFSQCGTVLSARVATSKNGVSLGYGYVSFAADSSAEMAIDILGNTIVHGQQISVEKFVEKSRREEKPWSNIHVSGLPNTWRKEDLFARFSIYGAIRSAVIMTNSLGHSRGFGFVDFESHRSAIMAIESCNHGMQAQGPEQGQLIKLHVTPAMKKAEKTAQRVPRAGSVMSGSSPTTRSLSDTGDFWSSSSRRSSYLPDSPLSPFGFERDIFLADQPHRLPTGNNGVSHRGAFKQPLQSLYSTYERSKALSEIDVLTFELNQNVLDVYPNGYEARYRFY